MTWITSSSDGPLKIKLKSADRLYFKESEQKWFFNLTVYINNKASTATCLGIENKLHCAVNELNQVNTILIKLRKTSSSDANIIFTNLEEDLKIPLWKELTLEKCGNIKFVEKTWKFSIFIQDIIPEDSYVFVDIKSYFERPDAKYNFNFNTIADCFNNNKELKCEYISDEEAWYETINLLPIKVKDSPSTVPKWNNMDNNYLKSFNLETNVNFIYSTKFLKNQDNGIGGHYSFTISIENILPKISKLTVDIIFGNKKSIVYCWSVYFIFYFAPMI